MAKKKNAAAVAEKMDENLLVTATDTQDFAAIINAHYLTRQAICFWGSSGYGKTSTVRAAAKELGYEMVDMRLSYRDPLSLFLPLVAGDKIEYIFSDVLDVMFSAKTPTIIFLDEITNPSSPEIYNVLKELLNERTFLGRKVSDFIVFVAASNWASEDTGVKELPDSLMRRMTHIAFSPDKVAITQKLQPLAKKFFSGATANSLLPLGHIEDFNLKPCPRQIDACERLAVEGGLRGAALRQVLSGRIGSAAGTAFADFLESELAPKKGQLRSLSDGAKLLESLPLYMTRFPVTLQKYDWTNAKPNPTLVPGKAITVNSDAELRQAVKDGYRVPVDEGNVVHRCGGLMDTLCDLQAQGFVTEIVGYLLNHSEQIINTKRSERSAELKEHEAAVAKFLGHYANPEIVRMVFDQKKYNGYFVELVDSKSVDHGEYPVEQPIPWPLPAYTRNALQVGELP